jgi:ankyrin repeat protein
MTNIKLIAALLFLVTSNVCLASYELGPCEYSSKLSHQLKQSIINNNYELFKESFEKGACINGQLGEVDDNPLFHVIRFRRLQMVKFLLSNGAFTEYIDGNKTPLKLAVSMQNNMDVIRELIKNGAKINQEVNGVSPLGTSFGAGTVDAFNYLISKGAIVSNDELENIGLETTANQVETVIKMGADVNISRKYWGTTPIFYSRNPEIIDVLINYGAVVATKDNAGRSALWGARSVRFEHFDTNCKAIEKLNKAGIELGIVDHSGETALISWSKALAPSPINSGYIFSGDLFCSIIYFISHADKFTLDSQDINGRTALSYMATWIYPSKNELELIKALLASGANINLPDYKNLNPLDYCTDSTIKKILIEAGAH